MAVIIYLESNQISDIKPLTGLSKAIRLDLNNNQISVKNCPVNPVSICKF
jgi:Leucine-rich repeat (LRR) protein